MCSIGCLHGQILQKLTQGRKILKLANPVKLAAFELAES